MRATGSGEAEEVMAFAGVRPGMSVADIGAGEGYYTVRLSPIVGPKGRVLAQDIVPATRDRLAQRVDRDKLDNVSVRLGLPDDPRIPAASFDRIFLVHMYHEVTAPYAFLWHLRAGLKPGGEIIVVDADRDVRRHGMPRAPAGVRIRRARARAGADRDADRIDQLRRRLPHRPPAARARGDRAVRHQRLGCPGITALKPAMRGSIRSIMRRKPARPLRSRLPLNTSR